MKKEICYFSKSFVKGHLNKLWQVPIKRISDRIPKSSCFKVLNEENKELALFPEHSTTQCNIKM